MPEKICEKCGNAAKPTDLFCESCGSSLAPKTNTTNDHPREEQATKPPSFYMKIEDTFFIESRGSVLTGKIQNGNLQVGDAVEIVTLHGNHIKVIVTELEFFHKKIDIAEPDQYIGVFLNKEVVTKDILHSCYGGMLYKAGEVPAQTL